MYDLCAMIARKTSSFNRISRALRSLSFKKLLGMPLAVYLRVLRFSYYLGRQHNLRMKMHEKRMMRINLYGCTYNENYCSKYLDWKHSTKRGLLLRETNFRTGSTISSSSSFFFIALSPNQNILTYLLTPISRFLKFGRRSRR